MPFLIIRNDITRMPCDAIVNAANNSLLGGGGVDGAIHRAAGPELLAECRTLDGCETGQAKLTGGYRLPAKYVIHTVGPIWRGGMYDEPTLLRSCYLESLRLAEEAGCETVAFPLISAGAYGYPKEQALQVARVSILEFLETHDMTVYLVVFDRAAFRFSRQLQTEISEYIDDQYAALHTDRSNRRLGQAESVVFDAMPVCGKAPEPSAKRPGTPLVSRPKQARSKDAAPQPSPALWTGTEKLGDFVSRVDESFSQMLLRKIDEAGISDAACYKKANIDRKLFSKIRADAHYKPSKPTAIAFALALELSLPETRELLGKAGYALSRSSVFDLIIEFFIRKGNYNVFEINEALFAYDQPLLGG